MEKVTNLEKKLSGLIAGLNLRMGSKYHLAQGNYGIWHLLDTQGNRVTSGTLAQIVARVESMLREMEKESSSES